MASITIRKLDEQTKSGLRVRAAHHNRSMEDEARMILRAVLAEEPARLPNLADAIRRRFRPLGGVELELPAREPIREPPKPGR
jgi:plasmid stability protein